MTLEVSAEDFNPGMMHPEKNKGCGPKAWKGQGNQLRARLRGKAGQLFQQHPAFLAEASEENLWQ